MSGDAVVLVEKDGPVTTIILNRPERRNAINRPTADALRDAFAAFEADGEARVAVLVGAGSTFCAGFDLTTLSEPGSANVVEANGTGPGPIGPTRMLLTKPVIAAVSGYAVAGGLELALWCDMRVAEEDAVFGVFCRRWGVPLVDGGTVRLPRIVGQGRAMDMILTGRPVVADEAHRIGLADRVVAKGDALAQAQKLARQIAAFPQECMKADRASAYRQFDMALDEALVAEGAGGFPIIEAEAKAGAARFAAGAGRHGSFDNS
jgi:enoyl-CoA hydratase